MPHSVFTKPSVCGAWEREGDSAQPLADLERDLLSTTLALLQAP